MSDATMTPEQLDGIIRGLDNACVYCDGTQAFDSARNIREAAAAISLLRLKLQGEEAVREGLLDQIQGLYEERDYDQMTRNDMRRILIAVADILKGRPPQNMMHSWHDLPEQLQRTLQLLKRTNQMLLSAQETQIASLQADIAPKTHKQGSCTCSRLRCLACQTTYSRQDGVQ